MFMAKVAILGFGVVGSGVAEVLERNSLQIDQKVHAKVALKYILDVRDFPDSPFSSLIIHDFALIENDPEVEIVVETIGGAKIAYEFTRRALMAGKSVVTSNKELVAEHGFELMELAREHRVSYLYEASVGGGIPIIHPLKQCLAANQITEVRGILNGTTNYILTRMIRAGRSFEDALKEAQQNGYAERDPTADIEGHDACRKICILGSLAFGKHIYPRQVPTQGISGVTLTDVAFADSQNCQIKLLGRAVKGGDGKVRAYVAPHLVRREDPLSGVEDVFNAITVKGNAIGDVMFYGRGAGKLPTASAVVSDVMEAVARRDRPKYLDWGPGAEDAVYPPDDLLEVWYVCAETTEDKLMAALAGGTSLSGGQTQPQAGESAALTLPMTRAQVEERLNGVPVRSLFRVLGD